LAADVLAENAQLTYKCLTQDEFEYLDGLILAQTSPEEAYRRFEILGNMHIDKLRHLTKKIQDARMQRDNELIRESLKEYDDGLEK